MNDNHPDFDEDEQAATAYAFMILMRKHVESISLRIQIVLGLLGLVAMYFFHSWVPALIVVSIAVLAHLSLVTSCRRYVFQKTGMPYDLQGVIWLSWRDNPDVAQKVFEMRKEKLRKP